MDRLTGETIQNEKEKEPSPGSKAKIALEAIREELTLTELAKKVSVQASTGTTC